jgi:hypothetical protein
MRTNQIPPLDPNSETGCCPRFEPKEWEAQELHFDRKPFVRASTVGVLHVPLNMSSVFGRTLKAIEAAHAGTGGHFVLSHDDSPWRAEHLFAVDGAVPGADMVEVSGTFLTKVFEGPFSKTRAWCGEMEQWVRGQGRTIEKLHYFYTTCPRCARHYGKNYVVAVAQVTPQNVGQRAELVGAR